MIKITRIVLHPNYVRSSCDGDRHFVTASQLMGLYNLESGSAGIPIIVQREFDGKRIKNEHLHLYPRFLGGYFDAPKFIREHNERVTQ